MKKYEILKGKFDGIDAIVRALCENGLSFIDITKHFEAMPASVQLSKPCAKMVCRFPMLSSIWSLCRYQCSSIWLSKTKTIR